VPYRVDLPIADDKSLDRLVDLGARDAEPASDGGFAALMPDTVAPDDLARALGLRSLVVTRATPRDAESVWVLQPRPVRVGRLRIVPENARAHSGDLRLIDSPAFGTGLHPTTALCLEALQDIVSVESPTSMLDVGTGSGVLALAALLLGVSHATGIDIEEDAIRTAGENARLNGLIARLELLQRSPQALTGTWPLIVANVLAAPLIEMAPALVRRLAHHGTLVLSGIPSSAEQDVSHTYVHFGMRHRRSISHSRWVAIEMQASW
jgi:ribosomal protein L11 methyltransferase